MDRMSKELSLQDINHAIKSESIMSQVYIQEFRGIKQCSNPVKLSKFTTLIGRNNSGKSAILESIALLYKPNSRISLKHIDMSTISLISSQHESGRSLVYGYAGIAHIEGMINNKLFGVNIDTNSNFLSTDINGEQYDIDDYLKEFDKSLNVNNGPHTSSLLFIPNNSDFIRQISEKIKHDSELREYLTKTGANIRVVDELITNFVDDNYTEIIPDSDKFRFRKELEDTKLYIHLNDLGEGIKKVSAISLTIELFNPRIILWDDFEGAAHPSLIKKLIEWLSKKECQVIISTHSIDVLRAIVDIQPDDVSIVMTKKGNDDILITEQHDLDKFEDILNSNIDPRLIVDSLGL